jgi:predicted  nucleic acid-binding Zn-ribbon protein
MSTMGDELVQVLTRFHRDVLRPDVERIVGESERRLRDEMHAIFDGLAQRLDRLETEYQMLVAGLRRVEERLDRIEQRMDKMALRTELLDLKGRVEALEEQIRAIEARLDS